MRVFPRDREPWFRADERAVKLLPFDRQAVNIVDPGSGARKREALVDFVRKYAPGHLDAGLDMIERMEATTRVFEIEIDRSR